MIAELDKDGSGLIEFDEFFNMMTTRPSSNESREDIHKVFVTFDNQKTGNFLFDFRLHRFEGFEKSR